MTVHDLTHVFHPDTQPASRVREIERQFPAALERCNAIITTSRHVKSDLCRLYPSASIKTFVAPIGIPSTVQTSERDARETLRHHGMMQEHFFLCCGTLEPRKNLALAIEAHRLLPNDVRNRYPLVLAGAVGWKTSVAKPDPHLHLLGYVDSETLTSLYRQASALVFPSIYEGFGLPVLEAMAQGTPVILHSAIASAEIAGNLGRYVDDYTPETWAYAMTRIVDTPIDSISREALVERSHVFVWANCIEQVIDAYRYALEHK
jgi:glycosyltransferase involved in cell wall biosynthesis